MDDKTRALKDLEWRPFILKVRCLMLLMLSLGLLAVRYIVPGLGGMVILGLAIAGQVPLVLNDVRILRRAKRIAGRYQARLPEARLL